MPTPTDKCHGKEGEKGKVFLTILSRQEQEQGRNEAGAFLEFLQERLGIAG